MSVLAIRCPTCGSAAVGTTTPNEYECSHCQSRFTIVRPADATVVSDTRTHHCPICGRAIQTAQSFRCTECGRVDFCNNCVASVPSLGTQRFVCRACMTQKGWACSACGAYATAFCITCKKRACGQHVAQQFGTQHYQAGQTQVQYYTCPACNGLLCLTCVNEKKGVFSTKYYCKRCGTQANVSSQPVRVCRFCNHMVQPTSSFCSNCGKALV